MKTHDIEQLMAYADGELEPQQAEAVERLLQDDSEARAIVERFRQTRAELAPGLDPWLDAPVPQRLIDAIRQHPGPGLAVPTVAPVAAPVAAPVVPVVAPAAPVAQPAAARAAANDRWYWPSLATAASVALVVGLVAGQWWGGSGPGSASGFDVVAQGLQTLPSGGLLQAGDTRVMPLASFRAADGQVCREFEQSAHGRQAHGIACTDGQQWTTRLLLDQGPADAPATAPPTLATASGPVDAMSAMVEQLRLGPALTPEQEEQALRAGWAASR